MEDTAPTWILLERDLSESVQIRGQRRSEFAIILDAGTGLIVGSIVGTSSSDVVRRGLKAALVTPAAPLPKAVPQRIVCPPALIDQVLAAAKTLSKLSDTAVEPGVAMWDAEEIFDSLVGHMEGRSQPVEPPSVADWRLVYGWTEEFFDAAPWDRWDGDRDFFPVTLRVGDDVAVERYALVLGNAGIQRGFNVLADPEMLVAAADATDDGVSPISALEASLIVHLDPWRETRGLAGEKARRYGWPADARLAPSFSTVRDGDPADLSQIDARLLVLSLRAVLEQDAARVAAVDAKPLSGEVQFDDGVVGRFEISRP